MRAFTLGVVTLSVSLGAACAATLSRSTLRGAPSATSLLSCVGLAAIEVPREVGGGGLHELEGVPIVVSRGIGLERNHAPQVRFGVPPEVVLL